MNKEEIYFLTDTLFIDKLLNYEYTYIYELIKTILIDLKSIYGNNENFTKLLNDKYQYSKDFIMICETICKANK